MAEETGPIPVASNLTADETAAKRAADRERLATLIGRLLARHWLRHQADNENTSKDRSDHERNDS
jgi:hypothetical protein